MKKKEKFLITLFNAKSPLIDSPSSDYVERTAIKYRFLPGVFEFETPHGNLVYIPLTATSSITVEKL